MFNSNTDTSHPATAAVDEAVRIASEGSRRTTENAQAALAFGRRSLDQSTQLSRELFGLWKTAADASMQTAFDLQNAALAGSQSLTETSYTLSKDAFRRWADLTRQAQESTLKAYQASTHLFHQTLGQD